MKFLVIIFMALGLMGLDNQESDIYGKWKLTKVEANMDVMHPTNVDYYLNITPTFLSYNLEVNTCQVMDFSVSGQEISFGMLNCTEICCDGDNDPISNFVDYQGAYEIVGNQLIITTDASKLYLERFTD